jgi:hypothetical protein
VLPEVERLEILRAYRRHVGAAPRPASPPRAG